MNLVTPVPHGVAGNTINGQPMDRLFDNGVIGDQTIQDPDDRIDDDTIYDATVRAMIDDSISFEESTLGPARDDNLRYFYGEYPEQEGEGKSSAVSTDFRDTVMAILPSLMRIFTSTENVVNCSPNHEGQEEMAKQCTEYLNYLLWEDNDGFLIIHDICKDALRCKTGVMRWWTDDTSMEVLEQTPNPVVPGIIGKLRIRFVKSKPVTRIVSVPLDEFRVSRKAKDVCSAPLIGHD